MRAPRSGWSGVAGLVASLAALGAVACGGEGPESGPGVRTVVVVSPAGPEGAALVRLEGPGVEGVMAIDGRIFHHARGDTVRVVVVREESGEIRFAVSLADTLAEPRGTVLEVADGENELRTGLSGYAVEIRR